MPADLTLPGDIPGLLQLGSIVTGPRDRVWSCSFVHYDGWLTIAADDCIEQVPPSGLRLDLTNKTGRIHLLWWAEEASKGRADFFTTPAEEHAIDLVRHGKDCTEADIIALRDVALRLAGRTA